MRLSPNPYAVCVGARSARRRPAATLVELLVVVSLIGLLASMLVPSISRSMATAKSTLCKHHLRQIDIALRMYQDDNDGWLPSAGKKVDGLLTIRGSEPWFARLFPTYLSDPVILTCPEDPFKHRMMKAINNVSDPRTGHFASYGLNSFLMTGNNGQLAETGRRRSSRPHNTIFLADVGPDSTLSSPSVRSFAGPARAGGLLPWDDGFDPFARGSSSNPWLTTRHSTGINTMTLGGGVREAGTRRVMGRPIARFYEDCSAGGCTFCNDFRANHYSFAADQLFWWTGAAPID